MAEDADPTIVHFNALVHALKSQLLPNTAYEEFLTLGGADRLTESLLSSSYKKEIAEALTRAHGADAVEDAVQRNRAQQIAMLSRLDRRGRLVLTDIAAPAFDAGAYGRTHADFMDHIHGRRGDGAWIEGVEVFRQLYAAIGRDDELECLRQSHGHGGASLRAATGAPRPSRRARAGDPEDRRRS